MALSDELKKQATERFTLIKITPRLRINDLLGVKSGTILEATLDEAYEISSVEEDGTALTESSTSNPSTDEYYWNRSTKTFEINVDDASPSTELVIKYVLRFTDSVKSSYSESGEYNVAGSYHWESRLKNSPSITVSVKNFIAAVPTIQTTSVRLQNEDNFFQNYIGGDNSWFNSDIEISIFIEGTKFESFQGVVRKATHDGDSIKVIAYDGNSPFKIPCLMGDPYEDAYYSVEKYGNNFDRRYEGVPIPYVFGRSRFRITAAKDFATAGNALGRMDINETNQAVCIETGGSLTWGLCRSSNAGIKRIDYGTINGNIASSSTVDYGNGTSNRRFFSFQTSKDNNIELWDTISIEKSSTDYPGVVTRLGTDSTDTYDSIEGFLLDASAPSGFYDGISSTNIDCIGVMILQDDTPYFPNAVDDYSITTETLSSGNTLYKIVFNSGFNSNHPGMNTLNWQEHQVFFRFTEKTSVTDNTTENEVMDSILESVGLTTGTHDGSDDNVNFQIPKFGDLDYRDVAHYVGLLCESRFAYVYQDPSTFNLEFKKFNAPSAENLIREDEILKGSLKIEFDGDEMGKELRIKNDHTYFTYNFKALTPGSPPTRGYGDRSGFKTTTHNVTSDKSTYFHELVNTVTQDTVYVDTSTRATSKKAILENEQMIIKFSTSTARGDLGIGDNIAVEHDRIPGDKSTLNGFNVTPLVIIGVSKSSEKIEFTAIDFKGLS